VTETTASLSLTAKKKEEMEMSRQEDDTREINISDENIRMKNRGIDHFDISKTGREIV
jgi:hypothetical protein